MKVKPIDFDETVFGFSSIEKDKKFLFATEDRPTRRRRGSVFIVPRSNQNMLDSYKSELVNDDTVLSLINVIVCGVSIVQHNRYFENGYKFTEFITNLRVIILVLSLSSILWILRRYRVIMTMRLANYQVSLSDGLASTGLYKPMAVEIFLACIVPYPSSDFTFSVEMLGFTVEYSLSAVLTFISILRLYGILRLFGHYSEYTQLKAATISKKHSVNADSYFALKCLIQESPFMGVAAVFMAVSLFTATAMMLCEEPDRILGGEVSESTLKAFWDNLWVIFYTSTTVGYGNIYPMTHVGRGICIISCILGNMYLGMLVVTIHNKMKLDEGQSLSYAWISRKYISKDMKKYAKVSIRKAVTLFILSKRWKSRTVSRIKPNGVVEYKGKVLKNDLHSMTEENFRTKLRIYRELRDALGKFNDLHKRSRDVGRSEIDVLYDFEDAVRVEFPKVVKTIKGKMKKEDIEISDKLRTSFQPLEINSLKVKDFSKILKKRVAHALRRKTTQIIKSVEETMRGANRSLTNPYLTSSLS